MIRRPRYIRDAHGNKQLAIDALIELHVFVIPPDHWRNYIASEYDRVISETWTAGYIRVHPDASLLRVREEIAYQLSYDNVPRNFVFLRRNGRSFQQVTGKQEHELQAKCFSPPETYSPDLYIMDATASGRYYVTTPGGSYASSDDYPPTYRASRAARYPSPSGGLSSRTIATQTGEKYDDYYDVQRVYMRSEPRLYHRSPEEERVWLEIVRLREERQRMQRLYDELTERSKVLHASQSPRKTFDGTRKSFLDNRDLWKKRFYEEKKTGAPLEAKSNKLKQELNQLHRRIITQFQSNFDALQQPQSEATVERAQVRVYAMQHEFDIEELQQKLQTVKMRLTAEMKLRIQAETELRSLKWVMAGRRGTTSMTRSQAVRSAALSARRSRSTSARDPPPDLTITPRHSWAPVLVSADADQP